MQAPLNARRDDTMNNHRSQKSAQVGDRVSPEEERLFGYRRSAKGAIPISLPLVSSSNVPSKSHKPTIASAFQPRNTLQDPRFKTQRSTGITKSGLHTPDKRKRVTSQIEDARKLMDDNNGFNLAEELQLGEHPQKKQKTSHTPHRSGFAHVSSGETAETPAQTGGDRDRDHSSPPRTSVSDAGSTKVRRQKTNSLFSQHEFRAVEEVMSPVSSRKILRTPNNHQAHPSVVIWSRKPSPRLNSIGQRNKIPSQSTHDLNNPAAHHSKSPQRAEDSSPDVLGDTSSNHTRQRTSLTRGPRQKYMSARAFEEIFRSEARPHAENSPESDQDDELSNISPRADNLSNRSRWPPGRESTPLRGTFKRIEHSQNEIDGIDREDIDEPQRDPKSRSARKQFLEGRSPAPLNATEVFGVSRLTAEAQGETKAFPKTPSDIRKTSFTSSKHKFKKYGSSVKKPPAKQIASQLGVEQFESSLGHCWNTNLNPDMALISLCLDEEQRVFRVSYGSDAEKLMNANLDPQKITHGYFCGESFNVYLQGVQSAGVTLAYNLTFANKQDVEEFIQALKEISSYKFLKPVDRQSIEKHLNRTRTLRESSKVSRSSQTHFQTDNPNSAVESTASTPGRKGRDFKQDQEPSRFSWSRITRATSRKIPEPDLEGPPVPSPERPDQPQHDLGPPWKHSVEYPPGDRSRSRTTVDFQDLERLDDGAYLNDNLVSFYLQWAFRHSQLSENEVYMFSTFFYTRLMTLPGGRNGFNYSAVERWTLGVNIFTYNYVIVPINEDSHWYAAIICNLPNMEQTSQALFSGETSSRSAAARDTQAAHFSAANDNSSGGSKSNLVARSESEEALPNRTAQLRLEDEAEGKDTPVSRSAEIDGDAQNEQRQNGGLLQGNGDHAALPIETSGPSDTVASQSSLQEESVTGLLPPINQNATPLSKKGRRRIGTPGRKYNPEEPIIIILDSLDAGHPRTAANLKRYLAEEAKAKISIEVKVEKAMKAAGIPLQPNFYDCGVYLLGYIDKFLKSPREFVRKILMREMDAETDWPEMNASNMRSHIRETLLAVHEDQEAQRRGTKRLETGGPAIEKARSQSSKAAVASVLPASEPLPQDSIAPTMESSSSNSSVDKTAVAIKPNLDLQEDSLDAVLKPRHDRTLKFSASAGEEHPRKLQHVIAHHDNASDGNGDDMLWERKKGVKEDKPLVIEEDDHPSLVIPDSQPSTPKVIPDVTTEISSSTTEPQDSGLRKSSTQKSPTSLRTPKDRRYKPAPEIVNLDDDDDEVLVQQSRTLRHSPRLERRRTALKASSHQYDDEIEEVIIPPKTSKYFSL